MSPKVSCILAVNIDNGYLHSAISSVLSQTMKDFELIIIANCSDKNTIQTIKSFTDQRIKLIKTDIGQLPFSLNLGIHEATGEYIARMDADDICVEDRFEKQVNFLDNNKQVDILGTNFTAIDKNGSPSPFTRRLRISNKEINNWLPISNPIFHPTVFIRKEKLLELKGYAFGFYCEDYELWLRARRMHFNFYNLQEKLLFYRIHPNQATSLKRKKRAYLEESVLKFRELFITFDFKFILGLLVITQPVQLLIKLMKGSKSKN